MPRVVEREHHSYEIKCDEKRLSQQPGILGDRDWRIVVTWPDRIEDEIAGITDGEDTEQPGDTESQRRRAPGAGLVRDRCRQHARCAERHHAKPSRLHGRDRQGPRARPPQRDVLHEDFAVRPARAGAVMGDNPERQEDAEDEEAKPPFGEARTDCHLRSPYCTTTFSRSGSAHALSKNSFFGPYRRNISSNLRAGSVGIQFDSWPAGAFAPT